MTFLLRAALCLGALLVLLALLGPLLALFVVLVVLVGLFASAVAGWALVLLAERWIDEGLRGFSFLDALSASLRDIVLGIKYKVYTQ